MSSRIYLDYAATTPVAPEVLAVMAPFHGAANAASSHAAGRDAAEAVEEARRHVARLIGGSLEAIGALCREREVLLHTDACVRTATPDRREDPGRRMYGPKGVGALWIRREMRHRIKPLMFGGGHERGMRSGTTNVAGCVGFGEAARIGLDALTADERLCIELRRRLLAAIADGFGAFELNGAQQETVPGIVNVQLPGVDAEALLLATPQVAASTGSACTSATPEPSHVLLAMGLPYDTALECLRLSFGRYTKPTEIEDAIEALSASAPLVRRNKVEVSAC